MNFILWYPEVRINRLPLSFAFMRKVFLKLNIVFLPSYSFRIACSILSSKISSFILENKRYYCTKFLPIASSPSTNIKGRMILFYQRNMQFNSKWFPNIKIIIHSVSCENSCWDHKHVTDYTVGTTAQTKRDRIQT